MSGAPDNVEPGDKWTFDQDVANAFDDMLERSIPDYARMRELCFLVGARFVKHGTSVVDLGCSRGEAIAPFVSTFGAYCRYVAVDVAEPMLAAARERFAVLINAGVVDVRKHDLRRGMPVPLASSSLILSVLTLQFTPIEYRRSILEAAKRALAPGGALIVVEKVNGRSAVLHDAMLALYESHKRDNGYTYEQIARKRASLEGVLVPLDAGQNYAMLREVGFTGVECFWRWLNFAAWVAHV